MGKTVYVLGAGFSKGVGAPQQNELIKEIFQIDPVDDQLDFFFDYRNEFKEFLEKTLYIDPKEFEKIALEDIYTPIDRCILDGNSFRGFTKTNLLELRQKINALLTIVIYQKLNNIQHENYVNIFARYLVNIKKQTNIRNDPFSILSLNWDILMDNALNNEIVPYDSGVIDYCCYITSYDPNLNLKPGLLARGEGKFNIKLLKLHGSMNWLQCQRCQRLFVAFGQKIVLHEYLLKPQCRLCKKNFQNDVSRKQGGFLVSQLIMPTFLKDLSNVQLKLVWHNAGIELSEAKKVVFMGYSFPAADFELRQLLARSVQHSTKIEFVLRDRPADPSKDCPEFRYRTFFGRRDVNPYYDGVEQYISGLIQGDIN